MLGEQRNVRLPGAQRRQANARHRDSVEELFAEALLNDLSVSSAKARRELGWVPRHVSFVAEAGELWRAWQAGRATPVR